MSKLDNLHTLVRLLKEFELPVSPILEYAIKEKENELLSFHIEGKTKCIDNSETYKACSGDTISFLTIKEEYSAFLHRIKSDSSANENLKILNGPVRRYINQVVESNADSIYSFDNLNDFKSCIMKLKNDVSFTEANLRRHHKYSGALSVFQKFLEKKENGDIL